MLLSSSGSRSETVVGYRFAGVVVDVQRARLSVDALEVAAGALPLKLLHVLCAAGGALVTRAQLFDELWPRQTISDEALTKLISRTRDLLGAHAATFVTVRGQGVRIDAPISVVFDFVTKPSETRRAAEALAELPTRSPAVRARSRRAAWLLAAALAALGAVGYWWWPPADAVLSAGLALHASDLQASKPATADLVGAAFKAYDHGETVHARAQMRTAHESDATTPVPALVLAWWDAAAPAAAQTWAAAARARLRADSPAYLRLLLDYFEARGREGDVRGPINALLDLRPQAWSLQFARAHDQLANREFAGALNSLQQIPLDIPDLRQVADVLADRIALGDAAAQTLALNQRAIAHDDVLGPYLRGRVAYSRGDLAAAIAAFDLSRERAEAQRDYLLARTSSVYAALAALDAGTADATARVELAVRLCHEQNVQGCEFEMLGLRAFLEAQVGNRDSAMTTLAEAWQLNHWDAYKPPLMLLAFENGLAPPAEVGAVVRTIPGDAVFGGVADLLRGWHAFAQGDMAGARAALELARTHGVARTYHAEDAALLGARLGEAPPAPCRVDPPYPNIARLSACIALRTLQQK